MALDTGIVRTNVIKTRGVDNRLARFLFDMFAARPVATFAAHIPLRHRFGFYIVIDRMAAVAERACGSLEIVRRIERRPPIGAVLDEILSPHMVCNVPLRWFGIIVIADLCEIALLPN